MKTTAVIFDLDGLLADSESIFYKMYQDLLSPYGGGFSIQDYMEHYTGKLLTENMTAIISRFSLPITLEDGLHILADMESEYLERGIPLRPGAMELLKYLKNNNYKIALASSSMKERALKILNFHGIAAWFDALVFGYEVENGKPAPDIFLKACHQIGAQPGSSLVLEDSEAGIQAAYSAGIPVICIPDLKYPSDKYADMAADIMDSLVSVIEYLKKQTY